MDTKKKFIITTSIIVISILGFVIYWFATRDTREKNNRIREINDNISEIQYDISQYRNKESDSLYLNLSKDVADTEVFKNFALNQVKEMFANKEYDLLDKFLEEFEDNDLKYDYLKNTVSDEFSKTDDLGDALKIREELLFLKFYNTRCVISLDSPLINTYIAKHGEEEIFFKPGTGYYANYKDSYSHKTIGISGSPLNDNESIEYIGDFKVVRKYGVTLNGYYEETPYDSYYYYFRDNYIAFSPNDGIIIYSGDYLLYFSKTTRLLEKYSIIK